MGKRIGVDAADGFHVIVIDDDEAPEAIEAAEEGSTAG